jgi:RNA polymerase sigma factor (sigma-70 family)
VFIEQKRFLLNDKRDITLSFKNSSLFFSRNTSHNPLSFQNNYPLSIFQLYNMTETQNFSLSTEDYKRLRQGDQRLQTKLFDRYAPQYVANARSKYSIGVEDAEEIVSSAFAKLFYKVLLGEVELDNLQGYVYTIVKHKCYERTEQLKRNIVETREIVPETLENVSESEMDNELMHTLNTAFMRLGERCQKLLSGFYWEEKDHKDIAAEWGISEDASRQRKRECMKKLRQLLGKDSSEKPLPC